MSKKIYSSEDELMYLARNMDDCTGGNSTIVMDWGNVEIQCVAMGGPSCELKNRLVDLANDYLRLKEKEVMDRQIGLLACQV